MGRLELARRGLARLTAEELEPRSAPATGHVELGEPHVHAAGWLALPDAGSATGWIDHAVPAVDDAPPARRRLGFGAARER